MAAAAVLASVGGWWYSARLSRALARVESVEQSHQRTLYVANVDRARRAIEMGQDQVARELLLRCQPRPGEPDLREFAWRYAWRQLHDELASLAGHQGDVYCVSYSPRRPAAGLLKPRPYRAAVGHRQRQMLARAARSRRRREQRGVLRRWPTRGHGGCARRRSNLAGRHWHAPASVSRPIRERLLAWPFRPTMPAWQPVARTAGSSCGAPRTGASLPRTTSTRVRSAHSVFRRTANCWPPQVTTNVSFCGDTSTRDIVRRLVHGTKVSAVAFDHSGNQFLAAARGKRQAWLWQAIDEFQGATPAFSQVVHAIGFDVSDQRFAVGTKDGTLELFETSTRQSVQRFRGHLDRIWSLSFSRTLSTWRPLVPTTRSKSGRLPKVQGIRSPHDQGAGALTFNRRWPGLAGPRR